MSPTFKVRLPSDEHADVRPPESDHAKATAEQGLTMAVTTKCEQALELLAAQITNRQAYTIALLNTVVFGNLKAVRLMLDHGADKRLHAKSRSSGT